MAKEQAHDLEAALSLAIEVLNEYEQDHPERSKEIIGHIVTLGTLANLFSDHLEFLGWQIQRNNLLEEGREKERQRRATLGL